MPSVASETHPILPSRPHAAQRPQSFGAGCQGAGHAVQPSCSDSAGPAGRPAPASNPARARSAARPTARRARHEAESRRQLRLPMPAQDRARQRRRRQGHRRGRARPRTQQDRRRQATLPPPSRSATSPTRPATEHRADAARQLGCRSRPDAAQPAATAPPATVAAADRPLAAAASSRSRHAESRRAARRHAAGGAAAALPRAMPRAKPCPAQRRLRPADACRKHRRRPAPADSAGRALSARSIPARTRRRARPTATSLPANSIVPRPNSWPSPTRHAPAQQAATPAAAVKAGADAVQESRPSPQRRRTSADRPPERTAAGAGRPPAQAARRPRAAGRRRAACRPRRRDRRRRPTPATSTSKSASIRRSSAASTSSSTSTATATSPRAWWSTAPTRSTCCKRDASDARARAAAGRPEDLRQRRCEFSLRQHGFAQRRHGGADRRAADRAGRRSGAARGAAAGLRPAARARRRPRHQSVRTHHGTSIIPATTSQVTSARRDTGTAARPASSATGVDKDTLAGNFQTFLTLLTTQLKNQNPLDPLDTNQFTQQLVQFAQVEQQLKPNDQLATLVSLQKTAQIDRGARLRRPDRRGRRRDRAARQRHRHLEPLGAQARHRHRQHQERDRPDRLLPATITLNAGTAALHLGRQGRKRPAMARRQLHDLDQRAGRQRPGGRGPDRDRRRRSIPPISPRIRRCFRSPDRTTRSTKSSASSAIRTDRAVTLRSFLAAGALHRRPFRPRFAGISARRAICADGGNVETGGNFYPIV